MKLGEQTGEDPIRLVAEELFEEAWLLCFDEFHVTDIADAMILGRLFAQLFAHGVVVVATSNVAPVELYKDGLNRALFVPFIHLLDQHMDVTRLDARTDFRLEKLAGLPVWYVPADAAADAALDDAWRRLAGGHDGTAQDLPLKGRNVHVPRAFMGVARFTFHDLCEAPLAAVDYLRLAHEYHTIILDHVPVMTYDTRNAAKRFIILIDTLYDMNVKLIASAAAEPDALYQADEGFEAAGIQAYGLAPHRDALAGLSGAAARRRAFASVQFVHWHRRSDRRIDRRPELIIRKPVHSGSCYRAVTSRAATTTPIKNVANQPNTISAREAANLPMMLRLATTTIMATISGTATTPLTTALQNNIRIGSSGVSAAPNPASVAAATTR